jgi:hypothetical protein
MNQFQEPAFKVPGLGMIDGVPKAVTVLTRFHHMTCAHIRTQPPPTPLMLRSESCRIFLYSREYRYMRDFRTSSSQPWFSLVLPSFGPYAAAPGHTLEIGCGICIERQRKNAIRGYVFPLVPVPYSPRPYNYPVPETDGLL